MRERVTASQYRRKPRRLREACRDAIERNIRAAAAAKDETGAIPGHDASLADVTFGGPPASPESRTHKTSPSPRP